MATTHDMPRSSTSRSRWPAWVVALGYGLLIFTSATGPMWAHDHAEQAHQFAQYVGLWPATLGVALGVSGIILAFGPMPRGERWAAVAAALPMLIIGIPRIATDPRCLASITPQHGCHTFLAGFVLVLVGAVVAVRNL